MSKPQQAMRGWDPRNCVSTNQNKSLILKGGLFPELPLRMDEDQRAEQMYSRYSRPWTATGLVFVLSQTMC